MKEQYQKKNILLVCLLIIMLVACSSKTNNLANLPTGTSKDKNAFSILAMGDLLIAKNVEEIIKCTNPRYPFLKIEDEFKKYDVVFANLETSITSRGTEHPWKPFIFSIEAKNAEYLKSLKIDIVNLANNHLLDYGLKGMYDTLTFVQNWGVKYCGAGWNLEDARKPAILYQGDVQIVMLGYCERPPIDFYAKKNKPGIAPFKLRYILRDIKKYKKKDNLVLVSAHWGIEHEDYPKKYQVTAAHKIIDAGADAIIGHHPHVPQGIEVYKGKPIIYSLGNLVSGYYTPEYKNNMMIALHYQQNRIQRLEVLPVAGKNQEIHFQPYVLQGKKAEEALQHIRKISEPFKTTMAIENNLGYIGASQFMVAENEAPMPELEALPGRGKEGKAAGVLNDTPTTDNDTKPGATPSKKVRKQYKKGVSG